MRIPAVVFGLCFLAAGVVCYYSVFQWATNASQRSPWDVALIACVGTVLGAAGAAMVAFGLGRAGAAGMMAAYSLLAFVLTFNWVAFAPGERPFVRKTSRSFSGLERKAVSESEGRAVFGVAALLMDTLILYGFIAQRRRKA
ncbi:hypothetical protein PAGU2595_024070 [Lysobacter xanthus]